MRIRHWDDERREQTVSLLILLALADREIVGGRVVDADDLYAELAAE